MLPFATSAHSLDPSAPPPAASSNPLAPNFPAVVPCIECPVCAGDGESQIRAAVLHGEQSRGGGVRLIPCSYWSGYVGLRLGPPACPGPAIGVAGQRDN